MSIAAQLRALADELESGTQSGFVGPGVTEIDGAVLRLTAPLRADWLASMTAREFTRYGRIGEDPSNAPEGYAKRSPAGYPLIYSLGQAVTNPLVMYDGTTHDDDGAVERYKAAVGIRNANSAKYV